MRRFRLHAFGFIMYHVLALLKVAPVNFTLNEYDDGDDDELFTAHSPDGATECFCVVIAVLRVSWDARLLGYGQCWRQPTDGTRWRLRRHRLFRLQEDDETQRSAAYQRRQTQVSTTFQQVPLQCDLWTCKAKLNFFRFLLWRVISKFTTSCTTHAHEKNRKSATNSHNDIRRWQVVRPAVNKSTTIEVV